MKSTRMISFILVLAVVLLLLYVNMPAGDRMSKGTIGVQTIAGKGGFTDFQKKMIDELKDVISSNGYELSDKPDINLFFTSYLHGNDLIVSVFVLNSLPEPIIKWGSEQEVFYKAVGKEELADKNVDHNVRRYMSEEYLRQFGMIFDSFVVVKSSDEVHELVNEIAERVAPRK